MAVPLHYGAGWLGATTTPRRSASRARVPVVILKMEGLPPPVRSSEPEGWPERRVRLASSIRSSSGRTYRTVPATHPLNVVAERWQPVLAPSISTCLRRPSKATRGSQPPLLDTRQAGDTFTDLSRLVT